MTKIDPRQFRDLKSQRRLSLKSIAGQTAISERTLRRIQKGVHGAARDDTMQKLVRFFGVDEKVLTGEVPLDPPTRASSPRDKLKVPISNQARNALQLVELRYGLKVAQIVEAAPLMFFILAEQSLAARRQRLSAVLGAKSTFDQAWRDIEHLPNAYIEDEPFDIEQRSIDRNDVFGEVVNNADMRVGLSWPDDISESNPFVVFLKNALAQVGSAADKLDSWSSTDTPDYQICAKEAAKIVGEDEGAVALILRGAVGLHEMPKELLRAGTPEARGAWVHEQHALIQEKFVADFDIIQDLLDAQPSEAEHE